ENIVSVDLTSPANCYVARWRFAILVGKQQGFDTIIFLYQHETHIYVLFNPWCKEDEVYFAEKALLNEYVLNSHGIIFMGSHDRIVPKAWNFCQ
ncbi:unnamed protein product, partial [Candidula unifasciata]